MPLPANSFNNCTLNPYHHPFFFHLIFPQPSLWGAKKQKEFLVHTVRGSLLLCSPITEPRQVARRTPGPRSEQESRCSLVSPPGPPAHCLSVNWKLPLDQQRAGKVSRKGSQCLLIRRRELFCLAETTRPGPRGGATTLTPDPGSPVGAARCTACAGLSARKG